MRGRSRSGWERVLGRAFLRSVGVGAQGSAVLLCAKDGCVKEMSSRLKRHKVKGKKNLGMEKTRR